MKHTYKTRGISGLYSGWTGMQCRQSLFTGIYFGTLGFYRDRFKDAGCGPTLTKLGSGFCGGVTGALAGNIPSDVVRSVVQKRVFSDPSRTAHGISPRGIAEHLEVAGAIFQKNGIRGLYTGTLFKATYLGFGMSLATFLIPFFSDLMGIKYDMG